jgi:protein-L-isoaspartate(D-aspartate) O-methyltransferase
VLDHQGRLALDIITARAAFAEELRFVAHVRSQRLIAAFASVPRENFLGPPPWQVFDLADGYWEAPADDETAAYHNVLFAIDAARALNNGHPEFWARLLDKIDIRAGERLFHVGAGTGYYTSIMAELTEPAGRVIAAEIDPDLAARARESLRWQSQIEVVTADGAAFDPGMVDVIVVNAGATHPMPHWLDSLMPGGRMLLPLTTDAGSGTVFRIERVADRYDAAAVSGVVIYPCAGARDGRAARNLSRSLAEGGQRSVRSLRRDSHAKDPSCWLHGDGFCLSTHPSGA